MEQEEIKKIFGIAVDVSLGSAEELTALIKLWNQFNPMVIDCTQRQFNHYLEWVNDKFDRMYDPKGNIYYQDKETLQPCTLSSVFYQYKVIKDSKQ